MRKGRIHIPLPDARARKRLLEIRMHKMEPPPELADEEMEELVRKTEGFSGSDLAVLISDAIMGPVRVPPAIPALQRRKLMLPHAVAGLLARASSLVPACAPCAMLMPRVSPPRFKRASPPASLSLSPGASGSPGLALALTSLCLACRRSGAQVPERRGVSARHGQEWRRGGREEADAVQPGRRGLHRDDHHGARLQQGLR